MATLVSGADARYGWWLLNLLGSVARNSPIFDGIVVYDLGLTPWQRRLIEAVRGVDVREVPPFMDRWREGRAWKTWIWTHSDASKLVWLDAGLSVLRPLDELLARIDADGYFVVSQGVRVGASTPSDYYDLLDFPRELADRTTVAAGILGFDTSGRFYREVIEPTYRDALRGLSIGWSPGEVERVNRGLDATEQPIFRDCPQFRHEQTLLNIHLYRAFDNPVVLDLDKYAGYRSPRDHPEQLIWSHRRRGDLASLPFVPYRPFMWVPGKAWGVWSRARWWQRNHSWLFKPQTYLRKARRLLAGR